MTDRPDHPPTDDELVAAVLDGEATPEEVARVESDPVLQARLEAFTVVAAAVGAIPETPAAAREAAVTAALGEFEAAAPSHSGDELAARRGFAAFGPRILAAAAAVVLLALAAVAVGSLDGEDDKLDQLADAPDDAGRTEAAAEDGGGDATAAADTTISADALGPADQATREVELQRVIVAGTLDELAEKARAALLEQEQSGAGGGAAESGTAFDNDSSKESTTTAPAPPVAASCDPRTATERQDLGDLVLRLDAQLADRPVIVAVYGSENANVLVVVDQACSLIASLDL